MEKENPQRLSGAHHKHAAFIASRGLEVTQLFSTFSRGTSIFLAIPPYRTGVCTQNTSMSAMGIFSTFTDKALCRS
jgi:hypothetical protein